MNERIKELAEQSYKEVIETNDYNGSAYTVREFDQEKFAELIIKECIAQVEKDHFGGRESWDRSIDNSVNNIKYNFGVTYVK